MSQALLKIPEGISPNKYREVIAAASMAYTAKRDVPTVDEIAKYCPAQPKTISKIISTPEFKALMTARGFNFGVAKLNPEQYFAVSILTDPSNRKPLSAKLKQAGITSAQYRAWLKQPHFREYITKVSEDMLGEHVQDVHTRVAEKAINGDMTAVKLYYELTGRHDPARQQMVDLQRVVGGLIEILTRYVTEPLVLQKIVSEMDLVMQGRDVHAIEAFDVQRIAQASDDTVDAVVVDDEDQPIGAFADFDILKD